jgi:hypothetical protein
MGKKSRKRKATKADIVAFLDAVRAFCESEYEGGFGYPGPRAVYYDLRARHFPGIRKGCEKLVKDRLIDARKRWIAGDRSDYALNPMLISDDYRAIEGGYYDKSPRDYFRNLRDHRANPWTSQDVRVIVLCEKAGKMGVVRKASEQTRTPRAPMGGDHSMPFGMELAAQIAEWRSEGLLVRVLYVGDHDHQGVRMDERITRELFLEKSELKRVAISLEQAHGLNLPTEDVIPSSHKSERTKQLAYIKEHGDQQVELDALPSAVLEQMIVKAIEAEIDDPDAWNQRIEEIEVHEQRVEAAKRAAEAELDRLEDE